MTDAETTTALDPVPETGGGLRVPRSRGVVSGVLLILAGAWGALAPFVGPYFDFAYTPKPDQTWHWTAARGWYEVLPGGLAVLGGLLLVLSANRILTSFGAWLAALAGGWFVVGQQVSYLLTLGSPGRPAAVGDRRYVAEYLAFFTGLGALIILFAALAIGRLSVRSVRDVRAAARRDHEAALAEQEAADREAAERDEYERSTADRAVTDRNAQTWAGGQDAAEAGQPASAVTSELPVAGAAAGATALGTAASSGDQHAAYRRFDEDDHSARPDDDTAAMPIAPEPAPAEPTQPEGARPEPAQAEPEAAQPALAQEPQPEEPQPEPVEPPLVLEPPEGHPDAQRLQAAPAPPVAEPAAPPVDEPSGSTPPETPAATWNPDAQSPTTTGELPTVTPGPPPEAAAAPYRRGVQQPRRYFGRANPAPADDAPAAADDAPAPADDAPAPADDAPAPADDAPAPADDAPAPADDAPAAAVPAPAAPEDRDAVRTDEGIDLDHEMDLDERPR